MLVDNGIADKAVPGHIAYQVILIDCIQQKECFAVRKLAGSFLVVHIFKFQQDDCIGLITVFFHKERYQDAVYFTDHAGIFRIVEHVTVRHQRDLPFYSVGLGKHTDLKYFFFFYHNREYQSRVIRAPMLFKRLSIF